MAKRQEHTQRVNIFFSPGQLEALQEAARKKTLTLSAFIRMISVEHLDSDTNQANLIKAYELEYQKRFNELHADRGSAQQIKDRKNASFHFLGGMLKIMSTSIPAQEYARLNELRQKLQEAMK